MDELVKRERAAEYVLIVVVSFAVSVILIRLYLELRDYPQISFSVNHISHVLWGGLLLFAAAVLMLTFSNTKVLRAGAVLTGLGMGFFIDEIGKFITKDYNYLYGPALPLIYISILLVFMIYIYLSRQKRETAREMFYDVLDDFKDVLDFDLEAGEKAKLEAKLSSITRTEKHKDIRSLAGSLLNYLNGMDYQKEAKKNWLVRKFSEVREKVKRFRRVHKILFTVLLVLLAVTSVSSIASSVGLGIGMMQSKENLSPALQELFRDNFPDMLPKKIDIVLLSVLWLIQFLVGVAVMAGISSIVIRKGKGMRWVKFALVFSLCSSDIILLYYNQLPQLGNIIVKIAAIGYLIFYERLYLRPPIDNEKEAQKKQAKGV
jgi:hypothetical protein